MANAPGHFKDHKLGIFNFGPTAQPNQEGISFGSAVPSGSGASYAKGAVQINNNPASLGPACWICTVAGAPGTWAPFGFQSAVAQDVASLGASTTLATLASPATGLYRVTIVISAHTNTDTVTATVTYTDAVEAFATTLTPISAVVLTHDSNTGTVSASVMIRASAGSSIVATLTVSGQTTTKASAVIERIN